MDRSSGLLPPLGIQAPWPRPGGGDVEPNKAEQDGGMPLVQHRPKAMWRMAQEIRDGHLARDDEGDRPGEQSEQQEQAAECLEGSRDAGQRRDRRGAPAWHDGRRKRKQLGRPELHEEKCGHNPDAGIACGGLRNTAGSSATVDTVRLAATGPSGSRSANRRLTIMGAVAYPTVASRTRAAPSSSLGRPATSMPSKAMTPPSPITSPSSRSPVGLSPGDRRTDRRATMRGGSRRCYEGDLSRDSACARPQAREWRPRTRSAGVDICWPSGAPPVPLQSAFPPRACLLEAPRKS